MSITYRTAGAWGAGIGQDLTASQVDNNFYDLATRVNSLETDPPEAVSITAITATASTFTIQLSDGTTQGPFKMPIATFNYRGAWTTATAYSVNDLVVGPNNAVYIVKVGHVSSGTSFNTSLTINGVTVFEKIIPEANTLVYRGEWQPNTAYYVGNLVRINGLGAFFVKVNHTSQNAFDETFQVASQDVYELILQESFPATPVVSNIAAGTLTLGPSHLNKWINVPENGLTIVVPNLSLTDWPIGGEVHFNQWWNDNSPAIIDLNLSAVNFDYPAAYLPRTRGYGAVMTVKRTDNDYFSVFGFLADA